MYDRGKDLNWKTFKDIMYLAAMGKVSHHSKGSNDIVTQYSNLLHVVLVLVI